MPKEEYQNLVDIICAIYAHFEHYLRILLIMLFSKET